MRTRMLPDVQFCGFNLGGVSHVECRRGCDILVT